MTSFPTGASGPPSTYSSKVAELTVEDLERKFDQITGGVQRLKERFFAGGKLGSRRTPSPSQEVAEAQPPPPSRRHSDGFKSTQCVYQVVDGRRVPVKLNLPIAQMALGPAQRDASSQPTARWPDCIELGNAPPRHIEYSPSFREPFYKGHRLDLNNGHQSALRKAVTAEKRVVGFGGSVGSSPAQKPAALVTKPNVAVVYRRNEDDFGGRSSRWFMPGKTKTYPLPDLEAEDGDDPAQQPLEPWYTPSSQDDDTLLFESRFESGNLNEAKRVGSTQTYDLRLQTDLYTTKHTQWFYFSVRNMKKGQKYTFRINNLMKGDSLYNHGMQPAVYSDVKAERDTVGWLRGGEGMVYYRNQIRVPHLKGDRFYCTLAFSYTCEEDGDTVYFAHCYPYTYTDLQNYLTDIAQDPYRSAICRQRVLCRTLAGNVCDMLTITEYGCPPEEIRLRKGVVVTSRIHPGESNASWMMKGFLDFILSSAPDAITLRKQFIFKVVPMINPDGVISGNYRTSLSGVDLNRVYKTPIRELYPTIFNLKLAMKRIRQDRPIVLYCDFHGHSRKQNVFVYGCNNDSRPSLAMKERIFPMMMSRNAPGHFNYDGCRFAVKKAKESTGRVSTWREIGMINCYTMEATFCGSTMGKLKGTQFNCADFEHLGVALCDSLLDYCDPNTAKKVALLHQLRAERLAAQNDNSDSSAEEEESSDSPGSDSSESDGATAAVEVQFRARVLQDSRHGFRAPIAPPPEPKPRPKTKKKLKTNKQRDRLRKVATANAGGASGATARAKNGKDSESDSSPSRQPKKTADSKKFKSRYANRSNNGMPTFASEQSALRRDRTHPPPPKTDPYEEAKRGKAQETADGQPVFMFDQASSTALDEPPKEPPKPKPKKSVGKSIIARYLQAMEQETEAEAAKSEETTADNRSDVSEPAAPGEHAGGRDGASMSHHMMDFTPTSEMHVQATTARASNQNLVEATLELLRRKVYKERKRAKQAYALNAVKGSEWKNIKERMAMGDSNAECRGPVGLSQFDADFGPEGGTGSPAWFRPWNNGVPDNRSAPGQRLSDRRASDASNSSASESGGRMRPSSHTGIRERREGPADPTRLRRPWSGQPRQFVEPKMFGGAPLDPISPSPDYTEPEKPPRAPPPANVVDGVVGVSGRKMARAKAASPAGGPINAVWHLRQQTIAKAPDRRPTDGGRWTKNS